MEAAHTVDSMPAEHPGTSFRFSTQSTRQPFTLRRKAQEEGTFAFNYAVSDAARRARIILLLLNFVPLPVVEYWYQYSVSGTWFITGGVAMMCQSACSAGCYKSCNWIQ